VYCRVDRRDQVEQQMVQHIAARDDLGSGRAHFDMGNDLPGGGRDLVRLLLAEHRDAQRPELLKRGCFLVLALHSRQIGQPVGGRLVARVD
jgi:hypothetical protein